MASSVIRVRLPPANTHCVWLTATAIVHASNSAVNPTHRRVLQLEYSADDLPNGLEWLGL